MIYQHRLVIARSGKLEKRHAAFQDTAMAALDAHGSALIGAWEVLIGPDAGCAVYQLRQFPSLADWEQHQARVRQDRKLNTESGASLYPHLDQVDTAIVRIADNFPDLPESWPSISDVRGQPTGYIEQRILQFRPGTPAAHHQLYIDEVDAALTREGASLIGLFDTVIGPGTTNGNSHRSIELRAFPDLASWERWRTAQDLEPHLRELIKTRWLGTLERVDSTLLKPLDYSLIRGI